MKVKLMALGFVLLMSSVGGVYMYIQSLQKDNEILTTNNQMQEIALDLADADRKLWRKDLDIKQKQIAKKQKQLNNLGAVNTKLKGVLNEMSKEDPVIVECLDAVPSDGFVDELLNTTKGQDSNQD